MTGIESPVHKSIWEEKGGLLLERLLRHEVLSDHPIFSPWLVQLLLQILGASQIHKPILGGGFFPL